MTIDAAATSTRFPTLEVAGEPRELGRQIGEALRDEIRELTELVLERFNKGRAAPISMQEAQAVAAGVLPSAEEYAPHLVEEVRGTAEAAGVPLERVLLINARNMLSSRSEGCTSVMVGGHATVSGSGIVGQNWDNDPAMDRFSVVLTRRPSGQPANMTFTQPGIVGYMGLNSEGIGVCMNALNGPSRADGVPWYFMVRSIYEQATIDGVLATVRRAQPAITANAAIVTGEGAVDIEITPDEVRTLDAPASGRLVHTNHCLHPDLATNNTQYADSIYGQSISRKSRAETLLAEETNPVSVDLVKMILSDHDGHPTSICRHPNDDAATGWQRSVVSMIVEPQAGRMHLSRGNPCTQPYKVYKLA